MLVADWAACLVAENLHWEFTRSLYTQTSHVHFTPAVELDFADEPPGVKAAALGVGVTFVAHARGQRRRDAVGLSR